MLRCGGVLAHHTATLPGVAASPYSASAIRRMQRFKQRRGPFLLLADSAHTALRLARWYSPALRRLARQSWPGPVTLLFAARPGLPACCYQRGALAVRVDAATQVRQLAAASGGLLLSSSLNRRAAAPRSPGLKTRMRLHRFLGGTLAGGAPAGEASTIVRIWRNNSATIRP